MISSERRQEMIAQAAYFRAEKRGFVGGDPLRDWIEAEAEVDADLVRADPHVSTAREEYLERLRTELQEYGKRLTRLRAKTNKLSAEMREEWEHEITELSAVRDSLRKKLTELRRKGGEKREDIKRQSESLWGQLKEGVDRLASRLER
jgi:chromosome segregation ATPase